MNVILVWAWLVCQTLSSSYSSIQASTWSGLNPLDTHCSITSVIFTDRNPFVGAISLTMLKIWSVTLWALKVQDDIIVISINIEKFLILINTLSENEQIPYFSDLVIWVTKFLFFNCWNLKGDCFFTYCASRGQDWESPWTFPWASLLRWRPPSPLRRPIAAWRGRWTDGGWPAEFGPRWMWCPCYFWLPFSFLRKLRWCNQPSSLESLAASFCIEQCIVYKNDIINVIKAKCTK